MNKPLIFMMPFFSSTAEEYVNKLNEIDDNEDLTVWLNSPGGSVFAGWAAISATEKKQGHKRVDVLGNASSMALYFTLFFNEVVSSDVSTFLLHRADGFTESKEEKNFLKGVNDKLREKLEARIDQNKLKELKDVTLDDIFSMESRLDVFFTAEQAKEIGLVSRVERLDTKELDAMTNKFVAFYDSEQTVHGSTGASQGSEDEKNKEANSNNNNYESKKEIKMTKEELKSQHPEVYKEIYNSGVNAERDRVSALVQYVDIDAETVSKYITEGHTPTQTFYAEMNKKAISAQYKKNSEEENTDPVNPEDKDEGKTDKQKEFEGLQKEVMTDIGFLESNKQED